MNMRLSVIFLLCLGATAGAQQESTLRYLGNEGVLLAQGETKVLFDPLFDNGFDTYQLVPDTVREAIFAGESPFDGIDAVFVSHNHGDHFSAADIMRLLRGNEGIRLYAPMQAVTAMRDVAGAADAPLFDRVVGIDLEYGDPPVRIESGDLLIEAAFIPHSGWPTTRTDVQNLAFRVTVGNRSTVLHLGDADPRLRHFDAELDFWEQRTVDVALPPYWFFTSSDGLEILDNRLTVINSIGIHVPAAFSDAAQVPPEIAVYDLFTHPGEGRRFTGTQ